MLYYPLNKYQMPKHGSVFKLQVLKGYELKVRESAWEGIFDLAWEKGRRKLICKSDQCIIYIRPGHETRKPPTSEQQLEEAVCQPTTS
jgi:hypothetical protein